MSPVLSQAIGALIVFLPAGIANMAPVFASKIPGLRAWNAPLDFGKSWHGKRLLGESKTWRGVLFGTVTAGLTGLLECLFLLKLGTLPSVVVFYVMVSMLMGLGALLGDAFESLLKRQRGVPPGSSWFPFDQIDYIIGGLLLSWPFAHWHLVDVGYILVIYFGLHLLFSYFGYLLGLKAKPI